MKRLLLYCLMLFASLTTFSQTYPIHDVDDCKLMYNVYNTNATYTAVVQNPNQDDSSTNVSSISASANNGSSQFFLPYKIRTETAIDWTARFYSANAGSNSSGSGRIIVRLINRSLGGASGNFYQIGLYNKTGATWQKESVSGVTATASNATAIDAAGGFDTILIIASSNASTIETLYFDNLEFSVNYNLTDDTANLETGNVWIYNNRAGDNKIMASSTLNITLDENITTPTTSGNSASNVLRVTRGSGATSVLQYNHNALDPSQGGIVKLRLYVACQTPYTNRFRIYLRDDGDVDSQYRSEDFPLVAGVWNEVSFDLSTLTSSAPGGAVYNNLLFLFDSGTDPDANGDIYYIDALQGPISVTLSTNDFNSSLNIYLQHNPVTEYLSLNQEVENAQVVNVLGKSILNFKYNASRYDVSSLSKGVYFVKVSKANRSQVMKFIKK